MFFIARRVRKVDSMRMLWPGSWGIVFTVKIRFVVFVYWIRVAEEQEE